MYSKEIRPGLRSPLDRQKWEAFQLVRFPIEIGRAASVTNVSPIRFVDERKNLRVVQPYKSMVGVCEG
jgi:hypothetical protein